jgi:hypothetical protein
MNSRGFDIFRAQGDSAAANAIMGQAYFIRGVSFWYLATTYGKGPRQVSSTKDGEIINQLQIYEQALSDFEKAEKLLPIKWTGADLGRATKGGAIGMEAKINMKLAGYYKRPNEINGSHNLTKANEYWEAAKNNIEDILQMDYTLTPKWLDNFTDKNENNSESIFEIQFKQGLVNGAEVGMHRPKFFGLFLSSGEGAWNDASPRPWLLDEFDKENQKDGKADIRKYYTLFWDNPTDTMKYYGKTYAEWKALGELAHTCYWRKYTSVDSNTSNETYSSGVNFRVIRLADIYLMYAEVINELNGNRGTAVEYINKVRRRVNMADLDPALYNDYTTLLNQIKHERLVELCGECVRWVDLDRWGDIHTQEGVNLLSQRDPDFNTYVVGKKHLYCIPLSETSLYPGLTQNPGYCWACFN